MEFLAKDFNRQNLQALIGLMKATNGFQNANEAQRDSARTAAQQIIRQGFSVGMTKLTAALSDSQGKVSKIDGQMILEIKPGSEHGLSLNDNVAAHGSLKMSGLPIFGEDFQQAKELGTLAIENNDATGDYQLAHGQLTINGQAYTNELAQQVLLETEKEINHMLDPKTFPDTTIPTDDSSSEESPIINKDKP